MLNNEHRILTVGAVWLLVATIVAAGSIAIGAPPSTAVLLFVLSVAPWGVALLIGGGAPPPTVAELLYAVHTRKEDSR